MAFCFLTLSDNWKATRKRKKLTCGLTHVKLEGKLQFQEPQSTHAMVTVAFSSTKQACSGKLLILHTVSLPAS